MDWAGRALDLAGERTARAGRVVDNFFVKKASQNSRGLLSVLLHSSKIHPSALN